MKDLLILLTRYNRITNTSMFDVLAAAEPKQLVVERKSYFGSVIGLLNHILVSDLAWLAAFRDGSLSLPVLDSPILDFEHPGWKGLLFGELDDLREKRTQTDGLFAALAEETPAPVFEEPISLKHQSGRTLNAPFGPTFLHVLNHQTHHRGAVAQILDEEGIENDYSNLLYLLMN